MTWQKWVLLAWLAFSVLIVVARIGKPQKPTTPGVAAGVILIDAALVLLVVTA